MHPKEEIAQIFIRLSSPKIDFEGYNCRHAYRIYVSYEFSEEITGDNNSMT